MVQATVLPASAGRLARIRELLALFGRLKKLGAPLGSPEGIRRLLELALQVAEFAGADDVLLDALRTLLADEQLLAFLASVLARIFGQSEADRPAVETLAAIDWLPLLIQLLKLLASLRAGK